LPQWLKDSKYFAYAIPYQIWNSFRQHENSCTMVWLRPLQNSCVGDLIPKATVLGGGWFLGHEGSALRNRLMLL
jgi:hypothetical protein